MASDLTKALMQTVYDLLLGYVDDAARTLSTYVGAAPDARIYTSITPDNAAYPYIVLRRGPGETDPEFGNLRERFELEARIVHRARDNEDDAETIADLVEGALQLWRESSPVLGVTFTQFTTRETLSPESDPINRDLVEIIVTATCISWSIKLSNALT